MAQFVSIDDKHRIKVGEPGYPVAAVEHGKEVIVSLNETFVVGDHDFTKISLIPSVVLMVNIPDKFEGSWYEGKVCVGFKDAVFKPSSPIRHSTEMCRLLLPQIGSKSILLIYSVLAFNPSKVDETLASQIELLHDIIKRLQLKGQFFEVYDAATPDQITVFWEIRLPDRK